MNIILLEESDRIAEDTVQLRGRRFEHWRDVLRGNADSTCKVGWLNGAMGTGHVVEVGADAVTLQIQGDIAPPSPLPVTLFMALPRPKTLRKVLHAAVGFGVKRLCFFQTWKVEKSYWSSPLLNPEELQAEIRLALEQAVDTMEPCISFHPRFKPFVEDELPALTAGLQLLLAHPGSPECCPASPSVPVGLFLGPEGGFTDYEIRMLQQTGARPVHLGTRILRTEVAVSALLGRLSGWE